MLFNLLATFAVFGQAGKDAVQAGKDIAIVETSSGKVQGYIHKGTYTYKGIPYAKADRFMAPEKPTPWINTRSSMTYGPVCPVDYTTNVNDVFEFPFQHDWGYMNENCQVLNVWTPNINDHKKRPVMVWFHGGGFTNGSSIEQPGYDGENLSRKGDVVVVSVNHRLNILGFLDLSAYGEKYKNSANAGLLDLVASLQWIHDNIAAFGGDPGNVLIFGQSGGGGKVTCLMNAPSAKGLFHKAVVESGSYLRSFMDPSISKMIAAAVLEDLQIQPGQIDSLQKIPYERLNTAGKHAFVKVSAALREQGRTLAGGMMWGPTLDGNFLPYQPNEPAALDIAKDVPLLVGTTKNEFNPFIPGPKDISQDDLKKNLQSRYGGKADAYMAAVKKAYPSTSKTTEYTDIDFIFRPGAINQANLKSEHGGAPVYMYIFAWQSPVNDGIYKAMHCMEIPFVFNNISRCEEMTGGGKEAYALSDKISSAWINFAKTGSPSATGLPQWPKYTSTIGATMIFDNKCSIMNNPDKDLLDIATGK